MEKSTSVSFSQFTQEQIKKLKEAFQLIDDDGDGVISETDLSKILKGLGMPSDEDKIKEMINVAPDETVTFPGYLSLMSETIGEMPDTAEIREAMKAFSDEEELLCDASELERCLKDVGFDDSTKLDRVLRHFSTKQVSGERVFKGAKFIQAISE
ncbi:myosin light chain 2 [Kluyveromyces marxianus]|uniref:Myosin light chain 2 n=2 Tax=Kluyveromyces marxianus TaxID=4911 RepID=W0TAR4_KLUMD|nr:myosin light chain 2 [Kluyveromyces marxianus DMKU3-1042]QGN16228.1 myosin light chain 2 [Kluyveromyces marxianus]BAO40500.1 myosin light chain 2 [Kluyveromyces marxianus DMKU3-1042]BAP71982.1 myosin light chain 2 [Kluyveromyces marxianus]